jgi:hypothetical protein
MLSPRVFVTTAIVGVCLLALGCGGAPIGGESEDVVAVEEPIGLWLNGNHPNFFWDVNTQTALRRLAAQPLLDTSGRLTSTSLLDSPEGREVLHYVVGCAVALGTTVATSMPGVSFEGAVGLAADWQKAPMADERLQRWETACLLQTLNGLNSHVPILMVGHNDALAVDPHVDVSSFTYPDATMFGNIFPPPVPRVPSVFACIDKVVAERCGNGTSSYANKRICDSSPTCGLSLLLPSCKEWCTFEKDGSARCQTPAGEVYDETITTFLTEDGFADSYRTCRER